MKPIERTARTNDIQDGDVIIDMSIDPEAMAHVMSVLTELYSDVELAVIREYSTNAWDAHIEAGIENEASIEVTLPTEADPFFRVRDFGEGLDEETIRNIYSRYGNSTKRGSNDVVGMLGMGCKSALAYTDEFYVTSVKNNVKISVVVAKQDGGVPFMNIVNQVRTNEKSGTEVAVPVEESHYNLEKWGQKARNLFKFWPEGSVKINGEPAERIDGMWLDGDTLLVKDIDRNYIVMGNVPYPVDYTFRKGGWIKFVAIGDVEFTPSREELKNTAYTKGAIARIQMDVKKLRDTKLAEYIGAAKTHYEALERLREAKLYGYSNTGLYHKGEQAPGFFSFKGLDEFTVLKTTKQNRRRRWSRETSYTMESMWNMGIFVGYTGKTISPTQEQKFDLWLEKKGVDELGGFLMVPEIPKDLVKWINPKRIFNYEDLKATKLPKAAKIAASTATFTGWTEGGRFYDVTADELRSKNLFYVLKKRYSEPNLELIAAHHKTYTIVEIGANQINKMTKLFPNIKPVIDEQLNLNRQWNESLSEDEKYYLALQAQHSHMLGKYSSLNADRVEDPAVKNLITLSKLENKELEEMWNLHKGNSLELDQINLKDEIHSYPLAFRALTRYGVSDSKELDHLYLYMNAVYAAKMDSE